MSKFLYFCHFHADNLWERNWIFLRLFKSLVSFQSLKLFSLLMYPFKIFVLKVARKGKTSVVYFCTVVHWMLYMYVYPLHTGYYKLIFFFLSKSDFASDVLDLDFQPTIATLDSYLDLSLSPPTPFGKLYVRAWALYIIYVYIYMNLDKMIHSRISII